MPHPRWSLPASMAVALLGSALLAADDPAPKVATPAKAKAKAKPAPKKARRGDEPPPCEHMISGRVDPKPPAQGMDELFGRMMDGMAKDPAGGFFEVMKDQERGAVAEVTLTIAEERQIGRKAREEFLRKAREQNRPLVADPAKLKYLRDLVANLSRRMKNRARYPEIDVAIVDANIPDGQSFPGGFLVFTSALLDEPDEATVAGVVAHELAHLDRGHLFEYAKREKFAQDAFNPETITRPDQFMTRGMAVGSLMMNPFRPEHEHEADCVSTTWLYQEGYDPRGLSAFLERMHRRNRDQPDNPFFRIARSHPHPLDRRDAVLERLAQLRRWKDRDDLKLYPENLRTLAAKPPSR